MISILQSGGQMWLYPAHIYLLGQELRETLRNRRINEIFRDPDRRNYYVSVGRPSEGLILKYFSAGNACRLNLIARRDIPSNAKLNPVPAPINGSRISECAQVNFDRILKFELDDGRAGSELYFSLIPSAANIIVTVGDDRQVIWSVSGGRLLENHRLKLPPPPAIPTPFEIDESFFWKLSENSPKAKMGDILHKSIRGIDKASAAEILAARDIDPAAEIGETENSRLDRLVRFLKRFNEHLRDSELAVRETGDSKIELFINFRNLKRSSNLRIFASPSKAIESFGLFIEEQSRFSTQKAGLKNVLKREITRRRSLIDELKKDVVNYRDFEKYRKFGDLLLINPRKAARGKETITVKDVFKEDQPEISIAIDPSKNIPDNAAYYYKKYRKARRGLAIVEERLASLKPKMEKLELLAAATDNAGNTDELDRIRDHFFGSRLTPAASTVRKADDKGRIKTGRSFRRIEMDHGIIAFIGRDNRENDELTFSVASKHDLWFHAQQSRGSHVILRRPHRNYQFPKYIIERAASLAAFYSKARSSSSVPVVYTEIRYVRKPKGAPPGKVVYSNEASILVEPAPPIVRDEDIKQE